LNRSKLRAATHGPINRTILNANAPKPQIRYKVKGANAGCGVPNLQFAIRNLQFFILCPALCELTCVEIRATDAPAF
jgi:hypothetical protein